MPLYRPSELLAFLDSVHVRPNKRLSQNFLVDRNVLDKIVKSAEIAEGDCVIEIGPGPGALTERLLEMGCKVWAVEKDPVFARNLPRLDSKGSLQVFHSDFLEWDSKKYITQKVKVVANLPYHITSDILERLVIAPEMISFCVVMVQQDAACRFQKARDFSSLFLQYHAEISSCFTVSKGAFYPKPQVESVVIRLDLNKRWKVEDEARFFAMLKEAYSHKRKMVKAIFKDLAIEQALQVMQKPAQVRSEELSCMEWVQLYTIITSC